MNRDLTAEQRNICKEHGCTFVESELDSKVGLAVGTLGQFPVNGLRHPPTEGTSGWYIWCGPKLSEEQSFFSPLHVWHLEERCPNVLRFLGLPAGYRFLLAEDHVDVWFDPKLLVV